MNKNQLEKEIHNVLADFIIELCEQKRFKGDMENHVCQPSNKTYSKIYKRILSLFTKRQEEVVGELEKAKLKEQGNESQKREIWGINYGLSKAISIVKKHERN